jgi:hypothetical protein
MNVLPGPKNINIVPSPIRFGKPKIGIRNCRWKEDGQLISFREVTVCRGYRRMKSTDRKDRSTPGPWGVYPQEILLSWDWILSRELRNRARLAV